MTQPKSGSASGPGTRGRSELVFSSQARSRLELFAERIEEDLRPDGRLADIKDWGSKLVGAVARIAGTLHVADAPEGKIFDNLVTADEVNRAIEIGEYLMAHALSAFDEMGADPIKDHARAVLEWLVRDNRQRVSKRDIHRAFQSRFRRALDVDPAIDLLVAHGYLRPSRQGGPGSRAARPYDVHPRLAALAKRRSEDATTEPEPHQ